MQVLFRLCGEFFLVGTFAVGGGLATIPFLQDMGRRHPAWFSAAKLADMIAASQCAPGPLGTNMAAYVGYSVAGCGGLNATGFAGAAVSVVSLMVPTVVVDLLVAVLLERFHSAKWLERLMTTLRPAAAGLLLAAAWVLLRISLFTGGIWAGFGRLGQYFNWRACVFYAALLPFVFSKKLKLHPAVFLAAGAVVGLLWL
jgi:chromate transporter